MNPADDGPPCPVCERPAVRVKDEDGRWVWECREKSHNNQETDDE